MEKIKNGRYWGYLCRNWLRAIFLGFVFLIVFNPSYAADKWVTTQAPLSGQVWNIGSGPTAICQAQANAVMGTSYYGWKIVGYEGRCWDLGGKIRIEIKELCNASGTCTQYSFADMQYTVISSPCPTGQEYNPATHQCIVSCGPNEIRNSAGQCQDKCFASKGQITGYGSTPNGTGCYNGCTLGLYDSGYACALVDKPNQKLVCGKYYNTGMSCDGANDFFPPTQSTTKEYDCLTQGKKFGYVNGIPTCIAPATPTTTNNDSTTTKTNSDGSTTSTSTNKTTTDNGDGTVTTTKTTTTTTTPSGGGSPTTTTETETETEDKQSFCDENPDLTICKESSFGGGCGGDWTCEGDAIQCAMAKEQHTRNCELFDKETGLSKLGNQLVEGTDPLGENSPFNPSNKLTVNLAGSDGQLDQSRLWGGSCLPNQTFSVYGRTYTLDTSKSCDAIGLFGYLLVACSMILAVGIVGKGA